MLASHEEGMPKSILEAMAAGLPTVVTRVGGSPEAVSDTVTGLVVEPHDPAALAEAIVELALDSDLRARMGASGRARIDEYFQLETCIAAYELMYESIRLK